MNEDKQHIVLTLDTHRIPLDVDREKEPFYRNAQKILNDAYCKYQRKLPASSSDQVWMYVALHVAVNMFASTREQDLEPYLKTINALNREIANKLNKNKN